MFNTIFDQYNWDDVQQQILNKTKDDVLRVLNSGAKTTDDFMTLISPAAADHLEKMAQKSHALTTNRFGKTIQLFIPLYLSNECQNICTYCGFSLGNKVPRKTLSTEEMENEIRFIKQDGFDHILLVTGEDRIFADFDYIVNAVRLFKKHFTNVAIEVQPFEENHYQKLIQSGCDAVLVYQETYNRETYKKVHPKGKKSNFDFRLQTPDRLGKSGIHKIGIGALLGLDDWRTESFFLALHLKYLQKNYWQTQYGISLPRIRPAEGVTDRELCISDKEFVQLICALRLFDQEVEISLSTREASSFRDRLIPLGITTMSAGSKTNPGGYTTEKESLEQFEISDERSPEEIAHAIRNAGYEPVWKNWDYSMNLQHEIIH